ncbi:hypothetical protein J6590_055059 [Homalodisca vitripennis]|nr:hypothetical protein J6590_055059 [Homalodisca vitripennis]
MKERSDVHMMPRDLMHMRRTLRLRSRDLTRSECVSRDSIYPTRDEWLSSARDSVCPGILGWLSSERDTCCPAL